MSLIGAALGLVTGAVAIAALVFWLWMLIEAAVRVPREDHRRITWILVILFGCVLGAAVYCFVQRPKNARPG